jgi:glutathione S-transferase
MMPDPTPLLWHFPISHYNEKVRFSLDYKGVAHRRKVLSGDYLFRVWWATGRRATLPVLHLEGRAIVDSSAIIAALEERYPDPPLYPADAAEHERALALEDWFDEVVGHPVRTVVVPALMEEGGAARTAETMMAGMGEGAKRVFRLMHPIFRRFYYRRHAISESSRGDAPEIVERAFDRVEAELGPSGYLVGARFSVADLTAAALLAPLVRPPGTIWAELGVFPPSVEAFIAPLSGRKATQWVLDVYARHRGASHEIP